MTKDDLKMSDVERARELPTDEMVREAMQTAWDDFCDDAQAIPGDIHRAGGKTFFRAGTWADHTAMHLRAALSLARPAPDEGVEQAWIAGELAGRQQLAHSEQAAHKAAILQKERAERAEALAEKYKWQVRDTCTRAEKAEAERDTLLAKAPVSEDGWQSIETAPRDGTPFLIFVPDDMFRPETGQDVVWWDHGEWLYGDNSPFVPMNDPTHWRPLPAPPTTEREDG